jgi:hypothetical protein
VKINFPNGETIEVPDPVPGKDPETVWLNANRQRLEREIPGKWVAIKGSELVGVADTAKDARMQAVEKGFDRPLLTCIRAKEFQGTAIIPSIRRSS